MEFSKLLKEPRIIFPIAILAGFECFMQTGVYRQFLRPDTYAYNVNRIRHIVRESSVKPNVLIIGTSVPYQGIQLPLLNRLTAADGLVFQSGATEGAMIETQYALYQDLVKAQPQVRSIVLVGDIALPWKSRYQLEWVNRSMVAQFPRTRIWPLLQELEFDLSLRDQTFFIFRTLTYQADLRDLILKPLYRIKKIGREERAQSHDYPHHNDSPYSLARIGVTSTGAGLVDLQKCVETAMRPELRQDSQGLVYDENGRHVSDEHQRKATAQTCEQARTESWLLSQPGLEWQELYFRRLQKFIDAIHSDGREVVVIYPPYARIVNFLNSDERILVWDQNLDRICADKACPRLDTRDRLQGKDSLDYFYDVLHLNAHGADEWTRELARRFHPLASFLRGQGP
ncbi:MAG: SGNH/GDSL hydrolase family protein [Leptospiraceae bacterium]|nr:SGNH/GDSL hydrolase family protein [Leptospiraceae bacterium]